MDGRGPRAVCSLTLQCVPRLKSLSSYSSQESLDSHSTGKTPEEGWSTLEPQVLPKAAASLQILATLLHITTVRKCKIHLPRFNRLHLSSSHSRAVTSTSNSFPQAADSQGYQSLVTTLKGSLLAKQFALAGCPFMLS